jgi:S-DNA-T family DNA segregation ATPase FtsK/SpoIIIE
LNRAVPVMRERMPGPDIGPDRLATRDWWTGPRLFVLFDDHDMVCTPMNNPTGPLVDLLAQGAEIGLHVVVVRTTSGGMRAMMGDPLLRRMWDLGTPGLLFSCPRDEGTFLGEAKPLTLPTGRVQLVMRRQGIRLVQTGLVPGATPGGAG